ncbi:AAA family ATPase [Lutibacter sp. B2]|nr:AAA family ATPase [Lutibacter sp. B2]
MDPIFDQFEQGKVSTEYVLKELANKKPKESNPNYCDMKESKALEELNDLIGLKDVKEIVEEILAVVMIQKIRKESGLKHEPLVSHMIFKGNPGTGKTTVARLIGQIFSDIQLLEKGHIIEVERADLVGEYIGHTAVKVREHIRKALGGVMFIDEAYSLCRGGKKDFGKEAIDALVKGMEDYKEQFILILAGYTDEMDDFLRTNPGLKSRFPIHIDFPDYTLEDLLKIAEVMLEDREYTISIGAKEKLTNILKKHTKQGDIYSGNARLVRNIVEKSIRKQALRLKTTKKFTRSDLITLKKQDVMEGEENV